VRAGAPDLGEERVDTPATGSARGAAKPSRAAEPGATSGAAPGWRADFVLQLAIQALSLTALNATRPIVTYQAIALGASTVQIGLVHGAFSVLPVLLAVAAGRFVDRGGASRYLVLALTIYALGTAGAGLATSLVVLALAQGFAGAGHIFNLVASQAMIANRGPREGRESRFGWYSVAASIGQLSGPTLAGIIAGSDTFAAGGASGGYALADGQRVFFAAVGAVSVALVLAVILFIRNRERDRQAAATRPPETGERILPAAIRVLRRSGMLAAMTVSVLVISTVDILIAYLPAYGNATGIAIASVGFLLSVRAGASLVSRVVMGRAIMILGRERTLWISMALAAVGVGLVPFTASVPVLTVLMVIAGLGLGVGQPMTIAWVAQRSPRAERGTALGVRLTGNRLALLSVPVVMGALAGAAGIAAIFGVLGLALAGGAILAARTPFDELGDRRDAVPSATDERADGGPTAG
jgi:MFS family permease